MIVPLFLLSIFVLAVVVLLGSILGMRFRSISMPGPWAECVRCNYSLSGLAKGAPCPECGLADAANAPRLVQRMTFERRWIAVVACGFGAAALLLGASAAEKSLLHVCWSSLQALDPDRPFLHLRAIAAPFGLTKAVTPVVAAAFFVFLMCRGRATLTLSHARVVGLIALLTIQTGIGFASGFVIAWYDSANLHARAGQWVYGGTLIGSLPALVLLGVVVRQNRVPREAVASPALSSAHAHTPDQ